MATIYGEDLMTDDDDIHAFGYLNRRTYDRYEVTWAVDCATDQTFLFASIANISEMGIFVRTEHPLPTGTPLTLQFAPPGYTPFKLTGVVTWINPMRDSGDNPNPGMGIRFDHLEKADRARLTDAIRTIAYLREPVS